MIPKTSDPALQNQANSPMMLAVGTPQGNSWQVLSYNSPLLTIHGGLLKTGNPFFIAGSGNNPDNWDEPQGSAVCNMSNGTFSRPYTPLDGTGIPFDLYSVGHAFLSDGRLMAAGGTLQYTPFLGLDASYIFDPATGNWTQQQSMARGRWGLTLVTLGNGKVLAMTGFDGNGLLNRYPEIYDVATDTWTAFSQPTSYFPICSHLFLLSSGKVFFSGGYYTNNPLSLSPRILTLPTDPTLAITETPVSGLPNVNALNQAASVLLPPAQSQKVMIIGGGDSNTGTATNNVSIVDLTASTPTYTTAASLISTRMQCSAILLPDRTVLVCNGSGADRSLALVRYKGEIYNPATNTWTETAAATVPRFLYSIAFLLPDGSVLTAGGVQGSSQEMRLEVYYPWYFSQTRPTITTAPTSANYGQQITIATQSASGILWVHLIRPSATNRSGNSEQRLVDCPINSVSGNNLTVTITSNSNIAPPGWYMLFITNQNKVPSVASWIKIS